MRAPADVFELIQRRTPSCEAVAEMLPSLADEDGTAKRRARSHVEHCLRCQAEVAGYRRMVRSVHALRADTRPPAPGTLAQLLAALEAEPRYERSFDTRRALLVGGAIAGAAAAAGTAGIVVWFSRRRLAM